MGVTEGQFSARGTMTGGFKLLFKNFDGSLISLMHGAGGVQTAGTKLQADITLPSSSFTGLTYQEGVIAIAYKESGSASDVFISNLTPVTFGTPTTMTWTLPAIPTIQAGGYFGVFLGLNIDGSAGLGNGAGEVYFDNVRFTPVPEPMTMAILGLGALAAMRKRRKGSK